jgi:Mitochondrial ribosomal subunit protein
MRTFALYRKAKTAHISYTCVPEWMKPAERDPFDYKLRSKEEVAEEFKYYPPNFAINLIYKKYCAGDSRADEDNLDNRERIAKISVYLPELKLAPLQRERFLYLLGPRYTGSDNIKIVCRQYNTYHENFQKAMEILREIYWEAKRAPSTNTTAARNPYRREQFKKRLGRTREERLLNMQKKKEEDIVHR